MQNCKHVVAKACVELQNLQLIAKHANAKLQICCCKGLRGVVLICNLANTHLKTNML